MSSSHSPSSGEGILRLVWTEIQTLPKPLTETMLTLNHAGELLQQLIGRRDREHIVALHLDYEGQVIAFEEIAIGSVARVITSARDVFKTAILNNSAGIIIGHNHPAHDPIPSDSDSEACNRFFLAGELLGIPMVDFFLVSPTGYRSIFTQPCRATKAAALLR